MNVRYDAPRLRGAWRREASKTFGIFIESIIVTDSKFISPLRTGTEKDLTLCVCIYIIYIQTASKAT